MLVLSWPSPPCSPIPTTQQQLLSLGGAILLLQPLLGHTPQTWARKNNTPEDRPLSFMSASRGTNASQRDDLYSSNMELSQTASENGSSPDREVESPVLATPIMPWQTPWGSNNTQEQVQDQQQYQATTPRNTGHRRALSSSSALSRPASFHHDGRSASFLVRERDRERVQRRVRQQHCHRQNSLNLLEARSINRTLDQQQQEARGEIAELRREQARLLDANHALRAHLQQERAALEHTREEEAARLGELSEQVMKLSEALTQQASLLVHEKKNRHRVEKELERCQAALEEARCAVGVGNIDIDIQTNNNPRAAMDSTTSRGDGDGDGGSTDGSLSSSSANSIPPPSASPSPAGLNDGCGRLPLVPEVLEEGKLYLTGTMSRWLKGMHSACSPQVRRALVLPWLLHKLFYLSTELIGARREELRDFFVGRVLDGMLYDEPAFLDHLRSNYLTLFPLSGDSQKAAIHDVMMGLACRCVTR